MKKKMTSLFMAMALAANLAIPSMASFVPSPTLTPQVETNKQIEIVTDNVVTGGYILPKGTPETRPLHEIDYPVIKITTSALSISANDKIDAAHPTASADQKADMMTDSALTYKKNASVNEVVDRYYQVDTTKDFVDSYQMSILDKIATWGSDLNHYNVVQIADISANQQAIEVAAGKSIDLTFAVPGVTSGSRVKVAHVKGNSIEFISASANNSAITFKVNLNNLGTFVLMTYTDQ